MFDKGETSPGIPYETGLEAVEALKEVLQDDLRLVDVAIKWILMHKEVSCVIPGASRPDQVPSNVIASSLPDLSGDQMAKIDEIYEKYIKDHVHQLW